MTSRKYVRLVAWFLLNQMLIIGCGMNTPLENSFHPAGPMTSGPKAEAIFVSVGPEARPLKGATSAGKTALAFIPLVPYGPQKISPEFFTKTGQVRPGGFRRDVADTVIKDLTAAGIARVVADPERILDKDRIKNPYYLGLTLKEGIMNRNLTLYGLSFAGGLLCLFLPCAYGSVEIELEAEMKSADGDSLGIETFEGKDGVTEWLYNMGAFTRALPKVYGQISPKLRGFVVAAIDHSEH